MEEKPEQWVDVEYNSAETPKAPETTPEKQEDEVSQMGPRAQKRIKQLVGKTHTFEAEVAKLRQEAEAAKRAAAEAMEKAKGTQSSANEVFRNSLQEKLKTAESKWNSSFDAADKEGMMAAQSEMMDARLELKAMEAWRQADAQKPEAKPQAKPPQQQIAPVTKQWMDSNPWFGRGENADKTATALAVSISDDLVQEGFDPMSQDFYEEVEKRLVAEMPRMASKLKGQETAPKPIVVGQSRSPARRIRLDEGTVKASQRLGASLEDTARYAEAIQQAGDGYVNIDIKRGRK